MNSIICQYCNTSFAIKYNQPRKYCSLSCSTSHRNEMQRTKQHAAYLAKPSQCMQCKMNLPYSQRKNKFCTTSCSALYSNARKDYSIIKTGPKKTIWSIKPKFSSVTFMQCSITGKWYSSRNPDGSPRRLSPYIRTTKEAYYADAKFKFNVYHFPAEFDLSLIDKHGWYTCPGKKRKHENKNTNGVSRDHLISVNYGFTNNIDPKIIAHPANCCIVLHSANKKKAEGCELTLPQLLDKIAQWDKKYLERPPGDRTGY